jgi:hypothetical protein
VRSNPTLDAVTTARRRLDHVTTTPTPEPPAPDPFDVERPYDPNNPFIDVTKERLAAGKTGILLMGKVAERPAPPPAEVATLGLTDEEVKMLTRVARRMGWRWVLAHVRLILDQAESLDGQTEDRA